MEIKINDLSYELKKMNPHQIATVANILGKLNVDGKKMLKTLGSPNEQFFWGIMAAVTGNDLIKFTAAIWGCDEKFAETNFDIAALIESIKIQMEMSKINGLITNFTLGSSPTP